MIQIPSHVTYECCIDDFTASVVLCESKHVASKVFELFFSDIGHGLADDLSDILSDNGIFLGIFVDKESESVDLGWCNVDIIGGLFDDKILLFLAEVG